MPGSAVAAKLDLIDTLIAEGTFRTLIGALQTVRMVDQWKAPGPFTLFAPTDEAFSKLPVGALADLQKPENAQTLEQLLLSHVAKGKYTASDLRQRREIEMIDGAKYPVLADATGIAIGGVRLLTQDIACTNGLIHTLEAVLKH